jgi:hypothetical protein
MVRTPAEWDAGEQGLVLAARPPVEVVRIADSAPEPLPAAATAPLSGVRVLDLTRVLAGPACARTLAQYGADVLAIAGPGLPSVPQFVADTGQGKRSASLDLKDAGDRGRLLDLVRDADVFSQGYRVGALERLGLSPAHLAELRPGLVYTSINCYGHEGPWRARPGWEQLAQTVTGMAHVHGTDGPELQPAAVTDYTTGYLAAYGTLLALEQRARFGGSYLVRVSLCQTGMWIRSLGLAGDGSCEPLADAEVEAFSTSSQTGFGPMRHLSPVVSMSHTPCRWTLPSVPLGTHPAAWQPA